MLLVRKQARNPIVACQDLESPTPNLVKYKKLIDSLSMENVGKGGRGCSAAPLDGVSSSGRTWSAAADRSRGIGLAAHECCS